jgi:hypothetical protein
MIRIAITPAAYAAIAASGSIRASWPSSRLRIAHCLEQAHSDLLIL